VQQNESFEQQRLMLWASATEMLGELPGIEMLHAIPNGGRRDIRTAIRLKGEGLKAGVPDLSLPVARGGYHGAYIEMKYGKNHLSVEQRQWVTRLRAQGYFVTVCYGWEEAAEIIERYLKGEIIRGEDG
jgi:hypothetical protein